MGWNCFMRGETHPPLPPSGTFGSERITGKFLKENNLRERIVLATEVFSRVGDLPNEGGGTRAEPFPWRFRRIASVTAHLYESDTLCYTN